MGAPFISLIRVAVTPEHGAFGVLCNFGIPFAVTLERTYENPGEPVVKIPPGVHPCVRTTFFNAKPSPYPTFEIRVFGHSRLLFHKGNFEHDSDGCVLVGESFSLFPPNALPGIAQSGVGFAEFMQRCGARDGFDLLVA